MEKTKPDAGIDLGQEFGTIFGLEDEKLKSHFFLEGETLYYRKEIFTF
jgi:hypothetical protein